MPIGPEPAQKTKQTGTHLLRILKFLVAGSAVAAAVIPTTSAPVAAYSIDCAILLCLAGGFPASTECTTAKAELIRRITPWPVEPPLQLWNCPMGLPADLASAVGMAGAIGSDGLTPEVRQMRDAIEIYQVDWRRYRFSEDEYVQDNTRQGSYDAVSGEFSWRGATWATVPDWLPKAIGLSSVGNRYVGFGVRAIMLRYSDYGGELHSEVVRY